MGERWKPRANHNHYRFGYGGATIGFGAATFTINVITLNVSAADLVAALVLALVIGTAGGFGPAWRAARLRPIEALRKA